MPLTLDKVVPWGRSLAEYIRMFALSASDLRLQILDCAGGPASFNVEMTQQGDRVVSCDPIYQFAASEIAWRIEETYPQIIEGVKANRENYIWTTLASPEQMGEVRMAAMQMFLADFPLGLAEGRYAVAELPSLSFETGQFDLALCSHFLFLYSQQLSAEFHFLSIKELCRVAAEVRIFPLLDMSVETSPHLMPVMERLRGEGYQLEIQTVDYEFQRGGNQLLRVVGCSV